MAELATQKTYEVVQAVPNAIIVHCSDPRFQKAFSSFIAEELGFTEGTYIPLVVSGAVGSLSEPLKLPKEFKFMKERIEMFITRFDTINRIILINHEDCQHYEALKSFLGNIFLNRVRDMIERQKVDLKTVSNALLQLAGVKVDVDLYYARFADGQKNTVVFEKIAG
ncbi:MAG: hypothetical protein V1799_05460 [bacterium]